jgi:hypothetical protein
MSRDASNSNNAIIIRKANNIRSASNSSKGTSETLGTTEMPVLPGRPATVTHQVLKGRQQQQVQYTCHSLDASNSSDAANISSASNNKQLG